MLELYKANNKVTKKISSLSFKSTVMVLLSFLLALTK